MWCNQTETYTDFPVDQLQSRDQRVFPMYAAERRQEIIKLLERDPYVSVADLAARFRVSRAAVRRDLNELRSLGVLERTYGGALKPPTSLRVLPLSEREATQREEKERIGKKAASFVAPGEMIFLDGGTTTAYLLPHLANVPRLTIATYAVNIIDALINYDGIDLVVFGGKLDRSELEFRGFLAVTALESYGITCEKMFLGASAVSAQAGVTDASLEAIPIKRKAIELSHEVIVVADSSKIGATGAGRVVPAARIHRLITGCDAPSSEIARLRDEGVIVDLV
jgi:DeoR/GlpR family transcriptional regulator of sugar metabolism